MRNLQIKTDLEELDVLLSDEYKWTKKVGARDINGKHVFPHGFAAVCWCIMGGAIKVTNGNKERINNIRDKLEVVVGDKIELWNDRPERTFGEVKQVIRSAIELVS